MYSTRGRCAISVISIIIEKFKYFNQYPLTIHKWLPLLGYCGVQYSECSASDSMSINVAETGDESEIGSNCAEDWIEIEGMSSKRSSLFSMLIKICMKFFLKLKCKHNFYHMY